MRFRYVTCMSLEIFNDYGKEMLNGLVKYWPEGEILCYSEDALPPVDGVEHRSLWDVPGARDFVEKTKLFPIFSGIIRGRRNYRLDVHRFCRKVFAHLHAAVGHPGYLFWVDADVHTTKHIPGNMLDDFMLGNFMCVMKRKTWHLCASFFGMDCSHAFAPGFVDHLYNCYMNGEVFALPEWHDSYVLETAISSLEGINDIAKDITGEGPYNVFDDVFRGYAHHLKGNLKTKAMRYEHLIEEVKNRQPKWLIEIGTWNGDRALQMAQASPGLRYFGMDLFEEATKETDAEEKNVKQHHALADVEGKLRDAGVRAKLYKGDSKQTFKKYLQEYGFEKADFIFIDGGHSVETIRQDLDNALRAIRKGGVIIMDDYYTDMPEEELSKFGAQAVLKDIPHVIFPTKDRVSGGGWVQMALIQC